MSAQGPWSGASPGGPPIRPGSSAYYNPAPPPPQTVVVFQQPASSGASFDIKAFGEKRFYALIGAVIGVIGVFQPWLSMGFIGISGVGMLQLASIVGMAGGQAMAMLLGAVLSIIGVAVAALLLLLKRDEKSLNTAGLCGLLAIVGAIIFVVSFMSLSTGGFGPGIGYGLYMTIVGGAVILWGTKNAIVEAQARQNYAVAAAWGQVPPGQPQVVMQAAPAYAPAYRPAPPAAQPMSNCPTCGAAVAVGAPRCNACGLALVWG